jgi:nitrate reductase molybdenum cofactor assembly chaperone
MVTMPRTSQRSRVLELFAELLEYPRPGLAPKAQELRKLVASESPEAAAVLAQFAAFVDRIPYDTLEEVFTATFDLNATCHPYVGFHIFGEDYRRSVFLLELKSKYREYGFDTGIELPDHISMMLRFMAICTDEEAVAEIARGALLPTLEPMMLGGPEVAAVAEGEEPPPEAFDVGRDYRKVLSALRAVLRVRYGTPTDLEIIPLPDQSRLVS